MILLVFLIGNWSLAFYANNALREDVQRLLGEQQFSMVSFVASDINRELEQRLKGLGELATGIAPAMADKPATLKARLTERELLQAQFSGGTVVYGADGTAIAEGKLATGRIGSNYADRDYLVGALRQGRATIGKPQRSVKGFPEVVMAVPIRDSKGKVIGALTGIINLNQPGFLDIITAGSYGKTGSFLLVAPNARIIVAASDKSRVMEASPAPGKIPLVDRFMAGYEGSGILVNPLGIEVLQSAKGIPLTGWYVAVQVATAEAFMPINELQERVFFAAILRTLLACAVIWWLLRRQFAPMLAAVNSLAAMADADQSAQPLPIHRQDEVGELIAGFNRLLETVRHRSDALLESERVRLTDSRLAADSLLSLSRAIEQSPVSIIICDPRGRIDYVNPKFETATGYQRSEVIGKNPRMLQSGDKSKEEYQEMWATLLAGQTWQGEFHNRRKDRTLFWEQASISPVYNDQGELINYVAVKEDITERRAVAADLRAALAAAEAANIAKSNFLATMSHEIRTPMNGILGMAQVLMLPDINSSEQAECVRTILACGKTLITLLNDILDISKIEAGKVELEAIAFSPNDLIQETRALFAEVARSKGLSIESGSIGQPRSYLGDPARLLQMLANLVGNAIKFSDQGRVRLEVREIESDEKTALLEFSVEDTGVGIPEDKRSLLFQRFSQTDASITRSYGGTGQVLAIVSNLAKLMGGEVGVESQVGQGSRFWFRIRAGLDTAKKAPGPIQAQRGAALAQFSGRVLVIEDGLANRMVIQAMLSKLGLTVTMREDGQEGLAAITEGDPADIILMDLHMPVMDGYVATARIRQWEAEQGRVRRPILALTADAFEENRLRCLAAGMDEVLTKPLALAALITALDRWLQPAPGTAATDAALGAATRSVDIPAIALLLNEILPLLAQNKFSAMGRFAALQEAVAGTRAAAEIDVAGSLLADFHFEQAQASLRRTARNHGWSEALNV